MSNFNALFIPHKYIFSVKTVFIMFKLMPLTLNVQLRDAIQ